MRAAGLQKGNHMKALLRTLSAATSPKQPGSKPKRGRTRPRPSHRPGFHPALAPLFEGWDDLDLDNLAIRVLAIRRAAGDPDQHCHLSTRDWAVVDRMRRKLGQHKSA
jgi:hypothetical protein